MRLLSAGCPIATAGATLKILVLQHIIMASGSRAKNTELVQFANNVAEKLQRRVDFHLNKDNLEKVPVPCASSACGLCCAMCTYSPACRCRASSEARFVWPTLPPFPQVVRAYTNPLDTNYQDRMQSMEWPQASEGQCKRDPPTNFCFLGLCT